MTEIKIDNKIIGPGRPVYIIAELGINHNGDLGTAKRMVKCAADAGVDAVKIQTFKAEDFMSDTSRIFTYKSAGKTVSEPEYAMFKRNELAYETYRELFDYAKNLNVTLFSTPSDNAGADLLEQMGVPAFKIGADYLTHTPFLEYLAAKKKPIILSAGMSKLSHVEEAVRAVTSQGNDNIILLHCVSSYPTPPEHANLRIINTLRTAFNKPVGFSDHSLGITAAIAAVALGACVIEKHFTLDKQSDGPDHWFSADPQELEQLVKEIRKTETMLGSPVKQVAPSEEETYRYGRLSLVAMQRIDTDEIITPEKIGFKRPGYGIQPKHVDLVIGRKARNQIDENALISWDDI